MITNSRLQKGQTEDKAYKQSQDEQAETTTAYVGAHKQSEIAKDVQSKQVKAPIVTPAVSNASKVLASTIEVAQQPDATSLIKPQQQHVVKPKEVLDIIEILKLDNLTIDKVLSKYIKYNGTFCRLCLIDKIRQNCNLPKLSSVETETNPIAQKIYKIVNNSERANVLTMYLYRLGMTCILSKNSDIIDLHKSIASRCIEMWSSDGSYLAVYSDLLTYISKLYVNLSKHPALFIYLIESLSSSFLGRHERTLLDMHYLINQFINTRDITDQEYMECLLLKATWNLAIRTMEKYNNFMDQQVKDLVNPDELIDRATAQLLSESIEEEIENLKNLEHADTAISLAEMANQTYLM